MADTLAGKKPAVDVAAYEPKVPGVRQGQGHRRRRRRKAKEGVAAAEYAAKPGAVKTASGSSTSR